MIGKGEGCVGWVIKGKYGVDLGVEKAITNVVVIGVTGEGEFDVVELGDKGGPIVVPG